MKTFHWPVLAGLLMLVFPYGARAQTASSFFPAPDLMRVGVYYYPEAWPSSQWERDIANIKKLGLEFVHMGEFAWAMMEPEEGRFKFDWLDRNIQLCAQQGLKVVLCTPSATPPAWLSHNHPEILMVDARGRRMAHGSREQACWSVDLYRQYVSRIVSELGKRYGKDGRVWGWQLDNELSHYGKDFCYCEACQAKFRLWLKSKYSSLQELNQAWGNVFWSQTYQSLDQVRIPNQDELVQQVNPHALLDFQRWFALEAADYLRFQAGVLRQYCGRKQWITSNFMNMHSPVYPPLSGHDLDIITWTIYPVRGELNQGPLGFRMGDPAEMSFMHDFLRSINGFEGLMELQPGQVNWAEVNPQPYPGAVYLWLMRAFSLGAKVACTYRYRQPLYGGELYHNGVVGTDGVTVSPGGRQFSQAAQDMAMLRRYYHPEAKEPVAYAARRAALLYSGENRWDLDNHKQTIRWDSMAHVLKYHRALKRLGCPVDVITEEKDFSLYPFLVAPAYQLVDTNLVRRWTDYVERGGHLVLTCRTAQKDRRGHLWEAPWAAPIHNLIGASLPSYDLLPAPVTGQVKFGAKTYNWGSWADLLDPQATVKVLATYQDQLFPGKPAATLRFLGKGLVAYVGVDSMDGQLEADLLARIFEEAGVKTEKFDDGFLVDWRDGFWVAANFTAKTQKAPMSPRAQVLIGQPELKPAGICVWMERP